MPKHRAVITGLGTVAPNTVGKIIFGAHIYGEILGVSSTCDAYHITNPDPHGLQAERALRLAIQDAGIEPLDIDYINAHGTSTPANDKIETMVIKRIFGDRAKEIPVTSTKSMIGHTIAAAGALEICACLLALEKSIIHPTINQGVPDPECDLNYVPNKAITANPKTILKNSFGFGGKKCGISNRENMIGFRPAKHCSLIIRTFQLWNALDLAWHNRLRLDPRDLEILKNFPKDSGLILTANHSDETDPRICIELSRRFHRRFTTMINAEAFEDWHGVYGWLLQRLGDFSVERGGNDQTAMRYAVDVVKKGHGALVMFPEGEISYLNDLVQPFKTGAIHIGLQAVIETQEQNHLWTAYILPVAIKYRYRKPIGLILNKKIRAIEKHLLIHASSFTFQEKIIRIMAKILKPQELISRTQMISEQLAGLKEHIQEAQAAILSRIETKYPKLQINPKAQFVDRAQKIIFFLREQLSRKKLFSPETRIQLQNNIKDLKETIQMAGWQPQYIDLTPSEERLAETVMKLEREVFKLKTPSHSFGNRDCIVRIGPPIDLGRYVEQYHKDPSTLSHQIAEELRNNIQSLIDNMI